MLCLLTASENGSDTVGTGEGGGGARGLTKKNRLQVITTHLTLPKPLDNEQTKGNPRGDR